MLNKFTKATIEPARATARPEPWQLMPMEEAVTGALQRLERRILAQGATITQPPTWPQIKGVSAWLETVWWNLLAIALQHANKTPLRIELGWDKEIHFRFWISDNGSGVSEPKRMKLFQPFERLHDPEAAPGLGLSFVNRLVDLHGGACGHLESPQSGACFFFQLP